MVNRNIILPSQLEPHQFLNRKPIKEKQFDIVYLALKKAVAHMFPNSSG